MSLSMAVEENQSRAQELERYLLEQIPLAKAMDLSVIRLDHIGLVITAPRTAFGGSISALMMLAGWGLLVMESTAIDMQCDIVIQRGHVVFDRPVSSQIRVECNLPASDEWERFLHRYQRKGRARIALNPQVLDEQGGVAVRFPCEYVAIRRESK
jgi:thioesterase domain-containing protein